jgi:Fe2+ or Zn2+ uptake regulation protein
MPDRREDNKPFRDALKRGKLRVTSVRLDVMRVLGASREALDASEVTARLDSATADRVTVYRTLNTLVESGLAHRVDPGDRLYRYSLSAPASEAGHGHHRADHPHVVCDSCGAVECLEDAEVIVRSKGPVAGSGKPGAGRGGNAPDRRFKVSQQSVTLHGTCEQCDTPPKGPGLDGGSVRTPGRRPRPRGRSG